VKSEGINQADAELSRRGRGRIYGTGEMAELTRGFAWQNTALGPIEQWPEPLIVMLNAMMATRHPMFLWWGPELVQFYNDGYRPYLYDDKHPKALGQNGPECWPEIWHIIGPQIEGVMTRGESTWHEDALVPIYRDGQLVDVYWTYSYSPVRSLDGSILGTLVTCSDTTARVLTERQLRVSEERVRMALSAANGIGTYDWDIVTDRVYADARFATLYGVSAKEASQGISIERFLHSIHSDDLAATDAAISEALKSGTELASEYRIVQKDGSVRWVHARGRCHYSAEGKPVRFPGVVIDITERKQAETALRRNEKLAAAGRLASSIAHEINNPLEAVTNLIYLANTTTHQAETRQYLGMAQQELARVANIVTQTLRFHRQSTHSRETSMSEVLDSVITLLQGKIRNCGIQIVQQYRTAAKVRAFEADLRQVFVNLVSNALDASHRGAKIILRVRDGRDPLSGEEGVRVLVADTGGGMSKETKDHIFEPFFTTKGGTGTGLGLWVSAEILRNHRARVRVRSNQSPARHGTVFSIFLTKAGMPS
jgi:PAS domain S-box-containing protein